jgi:hypothetical protein
MSTSYVLGYAIAILTTIKDINRMSSYQDAPPQSPTRVSRQDYEIRNKALELLNKIEPGEEVPVYEQRRQAQDKNTNQHISYQNSAEALEKEREAFRQHSARMASNNDEDWVGVLMPVVSCVGHACKLGITGIAETAAAGISMMKKETEERIYTAAAESHSPRGIFESVGVPMSYQGKYSDIPDHNNNSSSGRSSSHASRQHNGEAQIMSC